MQAIRSSILLSPSPAWYHIEMDSLIVSDPEILGGTPVFRGTRVPVETFFDYIEGGEPLNEFLDHFPTVTHSMALRLLKILRNKATSEELKEAA